jgi:hypothetical protein
LVKKYLGDYLKYHLSEHESIREIHVEREKKKNAYVKAEKTLNEKKEKMFKKA